MDGQVQSVTPEGSGASLEKLVSCIENNTVTYIVNKGTQSEKDHRNISVATINFFLTISNIKLLKGKKQQ